MEFPRRLPAQPTHTQGLGLIGRFWGAPEGKSFYFGSTGMLTSGAANTEMEHAED